MSLKARGVSPCLSGLVRTLWMKGSGIKSRTVSGQKSWNPKKNNNNIKHMNEFHKKIY